jgi:hypothetical protein
LARNLASPYLGHKPKAKVVALPNSDVVAFLVLYDVILVLTNDPFPKPTLVAPMCIIINVEKSLIVFYAIPMVIAPTNLE